MIEANEVPKHRKRGGRVKLTDMSNHQLWNRGKADLEELVEKWEWVRRYYVGDLNEIQSIDSLFGPHNERLFDHYLRRLDEALTELNDRFGEKEN